MSASRSSEHDAAATILRHGRLTRWLHGIDAALVLILLLSGLALGDRLDECLVELAGGHEGINDLHQYLGVGFVAAVLALTVLLPRRVLHLLRDAGTFSRGDGRWMWAFMRHYFQPHRQPAPFHDGRFDPAQRVVLLGIGLGVLLVGISGVIVYALPDLGRDAFRVTIRTHIAGAWLLLGCVVVHVVAGIGLPHTHRGLVRAMFGDGRVRLQLARTLWPGWTRRQCADESSVPDSVGHEGGSRLM